MLGQFRTNLFQFINILLPKYIEFTQIVQQSEKRHGLKSYLNRSLYIFLNILYAKADFSCLWTSKHLDVDIAKI